jgi:hypothetical protein
MASLPANSAFAIARDKLGAKKNMGKKPAHKRGNRHFIPPLMSSLRGSREAARRKTTQGAGRAWISD